MIRVGLAALGLLLGGCATSSLVLLPDEDGHLGSVAVLEAKNRASGAVIADGNSRTRLGDPTPNARPLGAKGLNKKELALLTGLPPAAKTFILYFEQGTTTLMPNSIAVLGTLRSEISVRPGAEVEVTGHTDTVGAEDFNDRLSFRRAEEVLAWLTGQGIDRSLMSAVGRGERQLVERTADNVGSAANRRVEVTVR